jgi:hypothetical protein
MRTQEFFVLRRGKSFPEGDGQASATSIATESFVTRGIQNSKKLGENIKRCGNNRRVFH